MRVDLFFLILFVIYCFEAGLFLTLAPWNAGWDRIAVQVPLAAARDLLLDGTFRGAITGFGLIHVIWGLHDLRLVLRHRHPERSAGRPPGDSI
jgi:hypothetical protein